MEEAGTGEGVEMGRLGLRCIRLASVGRPESGLAGFKPHWMTLTFLSTLSDTNLSRVGTSLQIRAGFLAGRGGGVVGGCRIDGALAR